MSRKSSIRIIDETLVFLAFSLANLRASIFIHLYPDISVVLGPAWIEIALWVFVLFAMLYHLARNNQIDNYLLIVRRNWLLGLFILLGFFSAFWSVAPMVTVFRILELLCATLIGAYIGIYYRPSQLMDILFWFGAVMLILSTAMAFAAPKAGTMYWPPFDGAWRGLFWHRNHLSSLTALLNIVYLCRAILAFEKRNARGFLDVVFYVLSLLVLLFAESATGYILFISLNFLVFGIWLWLKVHQHLLAYHYYLLLGIFGAVLILIFSNLDVVFGLFNRNTTLTGRVGLWSNLLEHMVAQRPWWGFGFGAVWTVDAFREEVRQYVGWTSQPLIADNGFLDVLLHVGVVGLVIFLVILIIATLQSFRYAITRKELAEFFPLLFMCYVFIANIPFSLLAETEVFIWLLIVAILFMTMPSSKLKHENIPLLKSE
jgi:exopolysaccharide production protein ExoQ